MEGIKIKDKSKKSEIKKGAKAGFWSGILASLCCMGALVIILFGLGTVSFSLSLNQYRPYFLGLGFLFMFSSIFLYLWRKNKSCDKNCSSIEGIKREKYFILTLILSIVITYFLTLYVIVPAISPIVYGHKTSNSNSLGSNLHILTMKIYGMTCEGCAYGIQSMLESLDGVIKANISYSKGIGEVIYDANKITKEKISNAIKPYTAEIIKDEIK